MVALIALYLVFKDDQDRENVVTPNPTVNPSVTPASNVPSGWETYESKDLKFKVSYSRDFQVKQGENMVSLDRNADGINISNDCNAGEPGFETPSKKSITFQGLPADEYRYGSSLVVISQKRGELCYSFAMHLRGETTSNEGQLREVLDTVEFVK